MSTRANIIITDGYQNQIFYRHSDGYPEGVAPTLQKFVDWVAEGKLRNNTGQAAGWLIMLGALEYQTIPKLKEGAKKYSLDFEMKESEYAFMDWKVGAYEPTDNIHGDIEYLYLIDLRNPSVKSIKKWDSGYLSPQFVEREAVKKSGVIIKPSKKTTDQVAEETAASVKAKHTIIIKQK